MTAKVIKDSETGREGSALDNVEMPADDHAADPDFFHSTSTRLGKHLVSSSTLPSTFPHRCC